MSSDSGYYYPKKDMTWYRNAEINSPVLSFAFKVGVEFKIDRNVYWDFFIGMGFRKIFTSYNATDVRTVPNDMPSYLKRGRDPAYMFNYTLTKFHMPVGLRLGVRI